MSIKPFIVAVGIVAFIGSAALAAAQSLGAIAKKEEARRKDVKTPGRVYTNDSLRPEPGSTSTTASTPTTPAETQVPPSPSGTPQKDDKPAADDTKKDEAYWKDRMTQARSALDRAQTFAEALQTRINSLSNDWAARDDPAQRNVIAADRQKALAELDRVRKEIQDNTKAVADIQDEARKAGVPAGWVR
jgi:hypothetical protein